MERHGEIDWKSYWAALAQRDKQGQGNPALVE